MMRRLAVVLTALCIAAPLGAEVVVLKDGTRVSGRVVDKATHYEVTTEAGVRTYEKDEVERVIAGPQELLVDADKVFEECKKEFQEALASDAPQQATYQGIASRIGSVRAKYLEARELFPEDKYADLDMKLVQIMQMLRLARDRVGTGATPVAPRRPPPRPAPDRPAPPPAPSMALAEAAGVLKDPALRADAVRRKSAAEAFSQYASTDVGVACFLFLSSSEEEWRLSGGSLEAFQEYLSKPWASESSLGADQHREAAQWIVDRVAALRKKEPGASDDALVLFGAAHLSGAPEGALKGLAKALGLEVDQGVPGTQEGQVVHDLAHWIRKGDPELAVLAWVKEWRSTDTPAVRYAWSIAQLRVAHKRKRGFDRAVKGLQSIKSADPALKAHIAALVKSIEAAANCNSCLGDGRLRCTNCHGKSKTKIVCEQCKGDGKMDKKNDFELDNCPPCKSSGTKLIIECKKCNKGYNDCRACDAPRPSPEPAAIAGVSGCPTCKGRGTPFRGVRWPCPECRGLGEILAPVANPEATLELK